MRVVLFYHSLVSDWNHGNAHFLRGYATELITRGHEVAVYEPADGWSRANLLEQHGAAAVERFRSVYPGLSSTLYLPGSLDLDEALEGADLVIAHEWNETELIARLSRHRRSHPAARYRLLFHDTHHRAVTAPEEMARYDLRGFDGVLAFGEVIRELYLERGWAAEAWTWHEAADTRVFAPAADVEPERDLVWIGNWGDGERTAELEEFLLEPVRRLGLRAKVYGVRYPEHALAALERSGIEYGSWLPNFLAPGVMAGARVTVHVPRGPYVRALPGIPTIRVFEALACGTPLVSAPWEDREGLFEAGRDFLMVRNGGEMRVALRSLLDQPAAARAQAERGLETVRSRHTCGHRVDELLEICRGLGVDCAPSASPAGRTLEVGT